MRNQQRQMGFLFRQPRSHSMSTLKGKWQFSVMADFEAEKNPLIFTEDSAFHEICNALLLEGGWEFAGTSSEGGTNIFYRDKPQNGDM